MTKQTINGFDFFKYYRLEDFAAGALRQLVQQLLETYIDQGNCVALVDIDKNQFKNLAQAYKDLLTGYKHPRVNSLSWHYSPNDPTLRKLLLFFPEWQSNVIPSL